MEEGDMEEGDSEYSEIDDSDLEEFDAEESDDDANDVVEGEKIPKPDIISAPIETTRILTDEDFKQIARLNKRQRLIALTSPNQSVPSEDSEDSEEIDRDDILSLVPHESIAHQPKEAKGNL